MMVPGDSAVPLQPDSKTLVAIIRSLLTSRPDAESILVQAAEELGFDSIISPGGLDNESLASADDFHRVLSLFLCKWRDWAADRRRLQQISLRISSLQKPSANPESESVKSRDSPEFSGLTTWSQRDVARRALAEELSSTASLPEPSVEEQPVDKLPFEKPEDMPEEWLGTREYQTLCLLLSRSLRTTPAATTTSPGQMMLERCRRPKA